MLLAQITDLHMCTDTRPMAGRIATRPFIAAAVDAVNAQAPDAVLVSGDLTDHGTVEEYRLLRRELDRLKAPVYVIPGNHDDRETLRAAFFDHRYLPAEGPLHWAVDLGPFRLIGLDSMVPGESHGLLGEAGRAWLDAALSDSDRPTMVAIHHPPFPTGLWGMDQIGCQDGAAMGVVLAGHPHVERVVAGHHHRPVQVRWAGTLGQICPSVAHQVALDFTQGAAPAWIMEPPAFMLHRWQDGFGLISHTVAIGDFGAAAAFSG